MKKLIILLLFPLLSFNNCLQLDLVLLLDTSGSVRGNEKYIINATKSFVKGLPLSENGVKVSIITFDSGTETLFHLTSDTLELKKLEVIPGGATNLIAGLSNSASELLNYGRMNYRKIIILISDGDIDEKLMTKKVANNLKPLNIDLAGVLIKNSNCDAEFLESISTEGMYVETDYERLLESLRKLNMCL